MGQVKSKAQYRKMLEFHKAGSLSKEDFQAMTKGVDIHSLPERIKKEPEGKSLDTVRGTKTKNSHKGFKTHKEW